MIVAVAGLGYVGLSLACLLSRQNEVLAVDIDASRVQAIVARHPPIRDSLIGAYLATDSRATNIHPTTDAHAAYAKADLVVIATPTDYDDASHSFDTSSIESVLLQVENANPKATVVIKSTVPVGYTRTIAAEHPSLRLLFSPEFLREGHALEDNLHPSRIIVGTTSEEDLSRARQFAALLADASDEQETPMAIMGSTEAEAVKLFANTYLALRVYFFNELDTYTEVKGLNARQVIEGVCLDPRIGDHYNNPSFGYGGYCLPKDSKQLLSNFEGVPQDIIRAVVKANETREDFIAQRILARKPSHIGVYRLAMKSESDNFRQSSSLSVISRLLASGASVTIYEPSLKCREAFGCSVCNDLSVFKEGCDVILANRWNSCLEDVADKVYTRDLWGRD